MKFIIFSLLVSFCLCNEWHAFRYKDGTFTKGNKSAITVSGSLYYLEANSYTTYIIFVGMDYSTMTSLMLILHPEDTTTTGIEIKLDCSFARHGLDYYEGLGGRGVLTGSWDESEFKAECYTWTGDLWTFKSSNVKSETFWYPPKEAGLRAKFLIDEPTSKYNPANIIDFAMFDYPYLGLFGSDCKGYLSSNFPDAPGPEPGGIMVGKDGGHCAILDNEGTKFIHSNSEARRVRYDSIAVAERYFPNGVIYKRCPNMQKYNLKFPFTKLANTSFNLN